MSNILAIIDNIVGMSVSIGNETPDVMDLQHIRNVNQDSSLPLRMILPYSDGENLSAAIGDFEIGNTSTIQWRILDRLLLATATMGSGIEAYAEDIAVYIGAYMDAVNALEWSSIDDRITVVNVGALARADIFHPVGSSTMYIGVDCLWELAEDDPP